MDVVQGFVGGESEPKQVRFEFRLSESQYKALEYLAEQYGISPSEVARRAIFAPERLSQMITKREWQSASDYIQYRKAVLDVKSALVLLHTDVARVGNNVNQVARKANSGDKLTYGVVEEVRNQFAGICERLDVIRAKCDELLEAQVSGAAFEE